jgi:hypothetical protein
MNIETSVIVGADAAVAQVTVSYATGRKATFTGTSKKHPKDRFNYTIGEQLAISRALTKASEALAIEANRKVEFEARAVSSGDFFVAPTNFS